MIRPPVVAIDFDGTLCMPDNTPVPFAIEYATAWKEAGVDLILWTCRGGDPTDQGNWLGQAVQWCRERGLEFDSVNDNVPRIRALEGRVEETRQLREFSVKPYCDFWIDDRNACAPLTGQASHTGRGVVDWAIVGRYVSRQINARWSLPTEIPLDPRALV